MRLFFLALLLLSLKSFAQKDNLEISIHVLPELVSDFKKAELRIQADLDPSVNGFEFDTYITYPFKINLPLLKNNDSVLIWLESALDIGEHNLKKTFQEFAFINTSSSEHVVSFPENCVTNKRFKNKICPKCFESDEVIPIIYGLPRIDREGHSPFDGFDHYLWGCDIPSCGPTWHCKRDNIEF